MLRRDGDCAEGAWPCASSHVAGGSLWDIGQTGPMSSDDLISALSTALESDPDNTAVRRLLASSLLEAGRPIEALQHLTAVLAARPDDHDAISLAEHAARAAGEFDRADAFGRLGRALGTPSDSSPGTVTDAPAASRPVPSNGTQIPDTVDDVLSQWATTSAAPEPELGEISTPSITLAQVGGLADVKARLDRSLFAPLRNPELAAAYGASVGGGLVLYGPPGCGKTYLARAVAGELGARFYSVGLSDVLDMWVGASERNIRSIFDVARAHAPCVLFLDEIDALGMRRTNLRTNPTMRNVVNQLLTELDGVDGNNEGIFLLAATNHPWDIDAALLRPGRLGQLVLVTPPDLEARAHILWSNVVDRPRSDDLDVWAVAARTEGFSGADLREVCEQAVQHAMQQSLSSGLVVPIDTARLLAVVPTVRPSIGAWADTARNVALFGNANGQYDDLAAWLSAP